MARMIDADALAEDLLYDAELCAIALDSGEITDRKELDRLQFEKDCKQNCVWYLTEAPTVDAVSVVRCAECKYNNSCFTQSFVESEGVLPFDRDTWFCADGERKGGDE